MADRLPKLASYLLALLAVLTPVRAQDTDPADEYSRVFQEGIDALNARRSDDGIKAFTRCLELRPEDPICAYNITCGYSLKGELDPAFAWFDKAIDWGYGNSQDNIDHAEKADTDLDNLRGDERFAKMITKMKERLAALQKAIDEYTGNAAIYVPEALKDTEEVGVLVVLHDLGSTKDAVLESSWKQLADDLGMVLVAPSGTVLAGKEPKDGMSWFGDFEAFQKRYWDAEKTISPALQQLTKDEKKKADPARTILAGEGQGGWVAFNAAVRAPRLYAGVVPVDAPVLPQMLSSYLANASALKVRLVANEKQMFGMPADQVGMFLGQMQMGLNQAKLNAAVARYRLDEKKPTLRQDLIAKTIREILGVAEAASAGEAAAPESDGGK
jgi:predicted esterase